MCSPSAVLGFPQWPVGSILRDDQVGLGCLKLLE